MFVRVVVPLLILGVLALLLFAAVLFWHRHRETVEKEAKLAEWTDSVGVCATKNPRTGWVCERDEGHYGNHWQTIEWEKYDWPDD